MSDFYNPINFETNKKSSNHLSLFHTPKSTFKKVISIGIMIFVIVILEYLHGLNIIIPGVIDIFPMIVLVSILIGDSLSGIVNSIIAVLFTFYYFSLPGHPFTYSGPNLTRVIVNFIILTSVLIIAKIMQNSFRRDYDELKNFHEQLSHAEELSQVMITYLSLDGNLLKVSPGMCNFLGYSREELLSMNIKVLTYRDDIDEDSKHSQNLIEGKIESIETEKRYVSKNGEILWAFINRSVVRDKDGNPVYFLNYLRNITPQKKIEEQLVNSEERYRKVAEYSPDLLVIHDGDTIEYANKAACKIFGVSNSKDLIGKHIYDFVHPDYHSLVKERLGQVARKLEYITPTEEKFIKSDGSLTDVEVAATPLYYKDKMLILSVARDITERKKAEELRKGIEERNRMLNEAAEYDKLKNEFFANLSHELRTPLNVILGALQLLEMYIKNNLISDNEYKISRYTRIMKQNCYRLLRLVNNLIDVTKIDAGFFNIHLKNYDIVSLVESITLSITEYVENKSVELQFDTDVEEKIIACDADKIERIILNLLSNAVKFTNPGGKILVALKDLGEKVEISVHDTGIGIPADKMDIIFERFRQVDKTLTRNHEGSGIGLSLVKSLVEMHGGTITAESEYEHGSTFIILLPSALVSNEEDCPKAITSENINIERINIEFSDIYSD